MRGPTTDLPIRFTDVHIRAGATTILEGVSLKFERGPPTVLIGPNGSGKTTLLRAAMGLIAPTSGRIARGSEGGPLPHGRAIVFQHPVMLRRSCAGNVRYALSAAGVSHARREPRTAELLQLVGLDGLAARPARRLSGGEQQRLALARALAREPDVLFLDEPSGSLDPRATQEVEDIVRAVSARGVKVVMTTHDLGEARRLAGEIVLLHRGVVIETALAEQFFAGPKTDEGRRFLNGELLV